MRKSILKKQKLLFDFAVGVILGVTFLVSVSAQNRVITKEEVETIEKNAAEKLENISYISFTSEKFNGNEKKTIYEFVPPDREHFIINDYIISITDIQNPQKATIIPTYDEWIYIGEKIYYRNGANKKWQEIAPDSIGKIIRGSGYGTVSSKPTVTTEYKLTPKQSVRGQETDLYEAIIRTKYSPSSEPSVEIYQYWINKNGLFVKTQHSDDYQVTTVDYLYSLNVEMEAPFIQKRKIKSK